MVATTWVHCLWFWYYLLFKIFSLEKQTFISANFFLTFSDFFFNFLLFCPYNVFVVSFPSSFPWLKSYSSTTFNFSYLLTSVLILPSKSATTFLMFPKSFSLFYMLYSIINLFQPAKYLVTSLIFHLFNIILTSYFYFDFTLLFSVNLYWFWFLHPLFLY